MCVHVCACTVNECMFIWNICETSSLNPWISSWAGWTGRTCSNAPLEHTHWEFDKEGGCNSRRALSCKYIYRVIHQLEMCRLDHLNSWLCLFMYFIKCTLIKQLFLRMFLEIVPLQTPRALLLWRSGKSTRVYGV